MFFNNAEQKILGTLLRTPLEYYSIRQLALNLRLAYPSAHKSVKKLSQRQLINIKKKGNSILCGISFAHPEELAIAALAESQLFVRKYPALHNLTGQLKQRLADELYIMILFGGYAKEKAHTSSDIDLLFMVSDKQKIKSFSQKVISVLNALNYNVDFEVVTVDWFYQMLGDKTTVGREIFKTSVILHNSEAYLYLIQKYDQQQGY